MAEKKQLTLKQWMAAVGIEPWDLATRAGCTQHTLREADNPYGIPISAKKAEAICKVLSEEHGRPIRIEDVKGLTTI